MRTWICGVASVALMGLAVLAWNSVVTADEKETELTVKEIMKKAHGKDSPYTKLKSGLKAEELGWEDLQKQSKEFNSLVTKLTKKEAPRGDKESWQDLTKKYLDQAEALNSAAEKKDKDATQEALTKMGSSCAACHKAHKGKAKK